MCQKLVMIETWMFGMQIFPQNVAWSVSRWDKFYLPGGWCGSWYFLRFLFFFSKAPPPPWQKSFHELMKFFMKFHKVRFRQGLYLFASSFGHYCFTFFLSVFGCLSFFTALFLWTFCPFFLAVDIWVTSLLCQECQRRFCVVGFWVIKDGWIVPSRLSNISLFFFCWRIQQGFCHFAFVSLIHKSFPFFFIVVVHAFSSLWYLILML